MIPGNGRDSFISQQLSRMSSSPKGIPALNGDPQFLNLRDHIILLIIGMDLILHQCRHDIYLRQKFL